MLSGRQKDLLSFIFAHRRRTGEFPSHRDIAAGCAIPPQSVPMHLHVLAKKGYIRRTEIRDWTFTRAGLSAARRRRRHAPASTPHRAMPKSSHPSGASTLKPRQVDFLRYLYTFWRLHGKVPSAKLFAARFNVPLHYVPMYLHPLVQNGFIRQPRRGQWEITDATLAFFGVCRPGPGSAPGLP